MTRSSFYSSAEEALAAFTKIYDESVTHLRENFIKFTEGHKFTSRIRAYYPFVRIQTDSASRVDSRLSYGFVPHAGVFEATLTRPDIFDYYYKEQFELLLASHGGKLEIGISDTVMPIHFALGEDFHLERDLPADRRAELPQIFDQPDLTIMDDRIANCDFKTAPGEPEPLALFTAPRTDLSVMRLKHYTGTSAKHFQNYILFTNYQFYIDEFIKIGRDLMDLSDDGETMTDPDHYEAFVEPGGRVTYNKNINLREPDEEGVTLSRMPQMPAYHLTRKDGTGITMVNIGVGPSNAKTITDHIAVLRPHAWVMLGHCAGLRNTQRLGDYVLAHGYLRKDHVLDKDLPPEIPVPALAEIQQALQLAVGEITGLEGYELKRIMRTGTVATIDDRNWELQPSMRQNLPFSQSRAIALDMESGTIAANGFRFRVPYGTLLCVSDKPLHGELKLPGMADAFYRERVNQHLHVGLLTMSLLREIGPEKLHSRKLRSFNEVAFQ